MRGIKTVFAFAIIGMFLLPAIPSITEGATRAAGDPVEGVHLNLGIYDGGHEYSYWRSQTTDASGNYDFTAFPPGPVSDFDLSVPAGYLNRDFSGQLTVLNQDQVKNLDLVIYPIPTQRVNISGTITDNETGLGISFSQADNHFWYYWSDNKGNSYYNNNYGSRDWATVVGTDGQGGGYYEFQAPPGDFIFVLAPPGYKEIYHGRFSASADREINFQLEPEPAPASEDYTLLVEVLDSETQTPLEGYVLYWEVSNDLPIYDGGGSGNTDNDGRYADMTGPGSGEVIVRGENGAKVQTHYPKEVEFIMPAYDNQTLTIELTPIDRNAVVQGYVRTNEYNPLPPDTPVYMTITNAHGSVYQYAIANSTGFYSADIPAGEVELRVPETTINGTEYYSSKGTVNVAAGETFVVDFSLSPVPKTSRVYGQVTEGVYNGGPTPFHDDLNGDGMPDIPSDPGDTTAPAAITNLAGYPGTDYVELAWTATGDDGTTGSASHYIIGYSTVGVITDINAANVFNVPNSLSPKAYGASEAFTVHGLNTSTQYWFMVVAVDDNSNMGLSNVFTTTTLQSGGNESQPVGEAGGNVALSNGAGVNIPEGALSSTTTITVERQVPDGTQGWNLGANQGFASDIYDFGPDGTTFSSPVTITLPYDPSTVPEGWNLGIYGWNLGTRGWNLVTNSEVDESSGTVSGRTSHFSRYAVLATADDTSAGPSEDGVLPDFFYMLGEIMGIPVLLLAIIIAIVMIGVGIAVGRRGSSPKSPPALPNTQPRYMPPPPPMPQPPQPAPPITPYPAIPPPTSYAAAPIATAPVAGGKKKPGKGKCSQCGASALEFYDNGSGMCKSCGRTIWWDKDKEPKPAPAEEKEPEPEPECPTCGSKSISIYPDGSRMCDECEHPF